MKVNNVLYISGIYDINFISLLNKVLLILYKQIWFF